MTVMASNWRQRIDPFVICLVLFCILIALSTNAHAEPEEVPNYSEDLPKHRRRNFEDEHFKNGIHNPDADRKAIFGMNNYIITLSFLFVQTW